MTKSILAICIATLLTFFNHAVAMNLDKMLVVSDKDGNGSFVMSNNKQQTYFVESSINEIVVDEDGEITKVKFNQDNIQDWDIALSSHRTIIEPGRTKSIGVKAICGNQCDFSQDKTYEVILVPKPYAMGAEESYQKVNVFIGYAPVFIIPAKEPELEYSISTIGEQIRIHNKSNTLIKVMIDNCQGTRDGSCSAYYTLIQGRAKQFNLPKTLVGKDLNITVFNHDESYRETTTVSSDG